VVYRDNINAWMLKSQFIHGYLSTVLPGHRDKALLTLITATLMRTFRFAKMNFAQKVYGGADPALQDKRIGPSPGFQLSIPVTQ
jgi:hypothetical protein